LILENASRAALQETLTANDIPSMIYYPIPAHKQQMFAAFGSSNTELPTTDWLTDRVISLPIHTEMDEEQVEFIIDTVKSFF
jgi:dTDP-4-amino-4,6-dideoxygalactose transaminase